MKRKIQGSLHINSTFSPSGDSAYAISDENLDALAGGGITGQNEARKLLDQYLASLDILSQRTDLSDDMKSVLRASMTSELARKISEAVSMLPAG